MARRDLFLGHRFPKGVILLVVPWYCRYPLSYRDVHDMLAERGYLGGCGFFQSLGAQVQPQGPKARPEQSPVLPRPDLAYG